MSASSTICVEPRPSTSGPESQIEATAIAGMVRPMLAIAEPRRGSGSSARGAAERCGTRRASPGISTSSAITTPTADGGAPTAETASSIAGDSSLARPTTATSATSSSPTLVAASRSDGGAACASGSPASTGRK